MRKIIWQLFHKIFPVWLHRFASYSQMGEDMVLRYFIEQQKKYKGFYVDVGAHHPFRFSNTAYFYKQGWRGINVEASPDLIAAFRRFRRRDINLNMAVGTFAQSLTFYIFNEQALNTFNKDIAITRPDKYKIIKTIEIPQVGLVDIFDKYLLPNQKIDFLSVDVEGLDLDVLKSNDWTKYIPQHILVESEINLNYPQQNETYNYLAGLNYELVAKTKQTLIFRMKT